MSLDIAYSRLMRWIFGLLVLLLVTAARAQSGAGSQDSVLAGKLRPRWGTYLIETYPSPAKASQPITVQFYNHNDDVISCTIFDAVNRPIKVIQDKASIAAGLHKYVFNSNALATGMYFIRLVSFAGDTQIAVDVSRFVIVH